MDRSKRSVIIPAYNEEKTIGKVVKSILPYAKAIVVNDNSSDDTANEAIAAGALVIQHKENKGYDQALASGFKAASDIGAEYVITFDADGQHESSLLPLFFNKLEVENYDLVLGIRPHKARLSEVIMGAYLKKRFGIKDALCGMKGYNLSLWRENNQMFCSFDSIGTELMFRAFKNKKRVFQLPIPIHERNDNPRFGSIISANIKILNALKKLLLIDISHARKK